MKEETKKQLLRLGVMFSPIFTIIMYLLPWMGLYNASLIGKITINYTPKYYNYFELLSGEIGLYPKILMWISLVGVASSMVLYVISTVFKDKEKLLMKIAAITLVAATGILFFTLFGKVVSYETTLAGDSYRWVDFMTIPYGLLIIYNVLCLFYVLKKMFK